MARPAHDAKAISRAEAFVRRFLEAERGAVMVLFALALIPILIGVGASIDYVRAYNARDRMQSDLDNALIASAKYLGQKDEDAIREKLLIWFREQTGVDAYTLDDIVISRTDYTIEATAEASIPTTVMQLFGVQKLDIEVQSAVSGPGLSYLNVYMLLDTSASQMLAASTGGQSVMRSNISCEFACHEGDRHTLGGATYDNNYDYSSAMGLKLRTDVMATAAGQVIDVIDSMDAEHSRIRVGIYQLNKTAEEVVAPTFDTGTARRGLADTSTVDGSFFDIALNKMAKYAGTSGNGRTAAAPRKFVIMVTDGVQSKRAWVTVSKWKCQKWNGRTCIGFPMAPVADKVAPLDPEWCDELKEQGVTIAVLYTKYLPIPRDWGYNGTLGSPMPSDWSGTLRSGVSPSITRQEYLPYALEDCASSPSLFMTAESEDEISSGMTNLFQNYLNAIHLTS